MTYAGALSFLRRKYSRDLDGVDIAVSGIPFDGAVTNRPAAGSGRAPFAGHRPNWHRSMLFRSALISSIRWPWWITVIVLDPHNPDTIPEAITNHAWSILATDTKMLTFGGDHFVSYPLIRAHAEKHGPIALIQFDAHCDTWDDGGYTLNHGSMFLHAKKQKLLQVDKSIQVGLRTTNDSDHGFEILTVPWCTATVLMLLEAIHDRVGDTPCYITFDIDCLDPAFAREQAPLFPAGSPPAGARI